MHNTMLALAAGLALTLTTAAGATTLLRPGSAQDGAVVRVDEYCGPGLWRSGLDNRCRGLGPYAHGNPGARCPRGWHIGPQGHDCWPNR